ncbi:single-stranded-DNA-specific exonuclease RecJ [Candidatus Peregrinibacteria bacterium]|nr:single-stranded-DNA-specific exonuclease RecJ [Candidatus Peregrinibacteria bacterium]
MSINGKKWLIKNKDNALSTFEKILKNRKFSFDSELKDFHDPFLFKEMDKSIKRILQAIKDKERIIIFGDYDVDGITGTAILFQALSSLNANVSYRIPNREKDGYGLSIKFIEEFIEKEISLIITVDCGISCKDEIALANKHNIDTIISDHHTIPKEPPNSFAILHPQDKSSDYPYPWLTGAGVALKIAQALIMRTKPENEWDKTLSKLIDLASLGTVADLGPLSGENRLIVKRGLKELKNTKWEGLKHLMELAGVRNHQPIDTTTIGFKIAPRINAAGRIDSPYIALKLLLQNEKNEYVNTLGLKLEELNILRQKMTNSAVEEAEEQVLKDNSLPFILIAHNTNWHIGIAGLVAGKLAEKYVRPVVIMQDMGDTLVGSARSPEFFNVTEAIFHCADLLDNFGGHAQAAGLNIQKKNLKEFEKRISIFAAKKLKNSELMPILNIDCEVKEEEINFNLLKEIEKLEPFGVENERPTFILKNREPMFVNVVGKEKNHLKFSIKINNSTHNVIAFNMGRHLEELKKSKKIDLAFSLSRNRWNNKEYLQLQALDIKINQQ